MKKYCSSIRTIEWLETKKINKNMIRSFKKYNINLTSHDLSDLISLKHIQFLDYNIGIGITSTLISHLKDTDPFPLSEKNKKECKQLYLTSIKSILLTQLILNEKTKYDTIVILNGRFACENAVKQVASKKMIDIYFHECGPPYPQDRFFFEKYMPHNFNEIIKSMILYLKGRSFTLLPDFSTGGSIDVDNYSKGARGGKVRVRSDIEVLDKNTLVISSVPYGITTTSLIDSIIKANDKNKIKIKNIEDNTSEEVEIVINLVKGTSPDMTIDALYAFTNCEVSISPNCCVIINNKPEFINVNKLLKYSVDHYMNIFKMELEYDLNKLKDKWHQQSLEIIFISNQTCIKFSKLCKQIELK